MHFECPLGATPLNPDEMDGLIPTHMTLQSELNEWEEMNLLKAEKWLFSKKTYNNLLTIDFLKLVHKKMFDDTWRWAGRFRSTEKTIGVAPYNITTDIIHLFDDIRYQINDCLQYKLAAYQRHMDEIACHFHHRLVAIHPFPNGNGRHARLMTDLLLLQADLPRFTWGSSNLNSISQTRNQYIAALRQADKRDYKALYAFVRL